MMRRNILLAGFHVGIAVLMCVERAVSADEIRLQIQAPKTDVIVGEPVVVAIQVETTLPVELHSDLTLESPPLRILIDRGQGFVRYQEWTFAAGQRDSGKHRLRGGKTLLEYVLSYDAKIQQWVFPKPGQYRVVAEYRDDSGPAVRSNTITINAAAAAGEEKEVHDAVLRWGEQSLAFHVPNRLGTAGRDLLERFPNSVYLQEWRLNDLNSRLASITNGFDPDLPPSAGNDEIPPTPPNFRPEVQRRWLTAVLPDAQDAAAVVGPFQPDAMVLLAGIYESIGEETSARTLYERVARDFPDRKAAEGARERIGDATPPELVVTASPSALWPPNHALVPIAIAVDAKDDIDPNPTVNLESITCDDGCDPAQDTADADLGTDDRGFLLRATRRGAGSGRTYTITYLAKDASSNVATKTATVTVSHDQRR